MATHIMLAAWDMGIASCWVNLFPNAEVEKVFGMGENEKVVLMMPMGYAAADAKPVEKWHNSFKPIEETVTYM